MIKIKDCFYKKIYKEQLTKMIIIFIVISTILLIHLINPFDMSKKMLVHIEALALAASIGSLGGVIISYFELKKEGE